MKKWVNGEYLWGTHLRILRFVVGARGLGKYNKEERKKKT